MPPTDISTLIESRREHAFHSGLPAITGMETISLSTYFPEGTQYFYGYPAGQNSRFFNRVTPAVEELISARSLVCAGASVRPIVFSAAAESEVLSLLRNELGVSLVENDRILRLPAIIGPNIEGERRNTLVTQALRGLADHGALVMAQPYDDATIESRFQLPTDHTIWLNDKVHLRYMIPADYLPDRYAVFRNGADFARYAKKLPIPCVVKVSSSSAGDGVLICRTLRQLLHAQKEYAGILSSILVQEYIEVVRNFGIQFGVPHDCRLPAEIIGVSEQLTTPEGEFIGGIVDPGRLIPEIDGVNDLLLQVVLPAVRGSGWYGVGGFDVLMDRDGRFYITDPNFRMTGMTPYLCEARNGHIRKRIVSFTGAFRGDMASFRRAIVPMAVEGSPDQMLHIIALTRHGHTFRMSGAMLFDEDAEVAPSAARLLRAGLESKVFEKLLKMVRPL
ncbi:hypothetical protein HYW84_04245 [Candidatus Peregrinibacteria bacterium]|nr:hypothetical protein [Candidatus Peregrinibacteria bacterium]